MFDFILHLNYQLNLSSHKLPPVFSYYLANSISSRRSKLKCVKCATLKFILVRDMSAVSLLLKCTMLKLNAEHNVGWKSQYKVECEIFLKYVPNNLFSHQATHAIPTKHNRIRCNISYDIRRRYKIRWHGDSTIWGDLFAVDGTNVSNIHNLGVYTLHTYKK